MPFSSLAACPVSTRQQQQQACQTTDQPVLPTNQPSPATIPVLLLALRNALPHCTAIRIAPALSAAAALQHYCIIALTLPSIASTPAFIQHSAFRLHYHLALLHYLIALSFCIAQRFHCFWSVTSQQRPSAAQRQRSEAIARPCHHFVRHRLVAFFTSGLARLEPVLSSDQPGSSRNQQHRP